MKRIITKVDFTKFIIFLQKRKKMKEKNTVKKKVEAHSFESSGTNFYQTNLL